ncbi:MAG: hypothetical protein ACREUL_05330 [Steroidobacteraceae bacterium]
MRETMRDYLRRRYQLALVGVLVGALLLISAPETPLTIALEMAGAIVFGSALVIAVRTRCPNCWRLFDQHVIAAMVKYSHAPPERCPHCGVNLNAPRR